MPGSLLSFQLVFKYVEKTYQAFLEGSDTFDEEEEELAKEIRKYKYYPRSSSLQFTSFSLLLFHNL